MTVETFADATPPAASAAAGGGGDAEKEAFDSAKELGTVEAWEAFIANYPSGFRADLARAYIKKLGSGEPAAAPPASTSVNTLIAEADASCKDRTKLRSQNSKTPTKLTFINRSGAMRGILWLDFDGLPKDYANLNDREQVTLDTFMTHPWMVTDGPGNCLRIVFPQAGGSVVELGSGGAATIVKTAPATRDAGQEAGGEEGHRLRGGLQAGEGASANASPRPRRRKAARPEPSQCPRPTIACPSPATNPLAARARSGLRASA